MSRHRAPRLAPTMGFSPDVILGLYERWRAGRLSEEVTREFAVFHVNRSGPFLSPPVEIVIDLLNDWRLSEDDVAIARQLPSLSGLDDQFWKELAKIHFAESVGAIPTATLLGHVPVTVSEGARTALGNLADDPPLALIRMTGAAAVIEIVSEGIATAMDCFVQHSRQVIRASGQGRRTPFFCSERAVHPLLGFLAAFAEFLGGASHPLNEQKSTLLLWVGARYDLAAELVEFSQEVSRATGIEVSWMATQ